MIQEPRRAIFFIIIVSTALGPMATHIVLPSIPGLVRVFDSDFVTVQLTLTLYLAAFALAQLVYGPVSDRIGRRPALLAGLGLYLAGSLICLLSPTIEMLIAGRVVQAVGGCAGMVLGRAMVRDLYEQARAASLIAYVTMAMVLAPMMSPTIGGFLDEWFGWSSIFQFLFGLGAAVLLAAALLLPETHGEPTDGPGALSMVRSYGKILGQRAFLGYSFQIVFSMGVWMSFVGGAPFVTIELQGLSPSEFGLYFISVSGFFAAGNFTAGRISQQVGSNRMIAMGSWVVIASMAMLGFNTFAGELDTFSLFLPAMVMSFGQGLSLPNAMAGAVSVDPRHIGAASGLTGFMQMTSAAICTYLMGLLLVDTAVPMVITMMVLSVLAYAAFFLGTWPRRE